MITTGDLMVDILKTATVTLISCKALKVMGKKDFGEIIAFSGVCILGVDIVQVVKPIATTIKQTFDKIEATCHGIEAFFDKLDKSAQTIKDFFAW